MKQSSDLCKLPSLTVLALACSRDSIPLAPSGASKRWPPCCSKSRRWLGSNKYRFMSFSSRIGSTAAAVACRQGSTTAGKRAGPAEDTRPAGQLRDRAAVLVQEDSRSTSAKRRGGCHSTLTEPLSVSRNALATSLLTSLSPGGW
jgi:hypothetical protein